MLRIRAKDRQKAPGKMSDKKCLFDGYGGYLPPGVSLILIHFLYLQLIFQVFNKKNTSKVGIDDIEFKTETEGTTESFITAYKYRNEGLLKRAEGGYC